MPDMKIMLAMVFTLILLIGSSVFLMSVCMWGCPNTGIQLVLKITTSGLGVLLGYLAYVAWFKNNKKGFSGDTE